MSPPLDKGLACLNCRRRKVRCDAIKPQCGPCGASRAYQDCEFTDSGPTRTQQLQAQIAELESRIKEIERPLDVERHQEAVISPSVRAALLQRFLKSTCTTWFFLNVDRFSSAFLDPHETLNTTLTNTVILWGIHLSQSSPLSHHESEDLYLTRTGLVDSEPYLVQLIQAEVLLALYFFKNARMMEGRYHVSLALSMVFGAGFHKIGSCSSQASNVAPPKDAVEEGERVSAFWVVVALNNCWTTRESNVSYEDVDTPWPLEMHLNLVPVNYAPSSRRTVSNWLKGEAEDLNFDSPLAQLAKASVLYEQAIQNGLQCRANPAQFLTNFGRLRTCISQLLPQTTSVLVQVLLHSATLQLYLPVVDINPDATGNMLTAIRSICRVLRDVHAEDVDPFLSTLLASACRFLISYEKPRRTNPEVVDMLRVLVDVMTEMGKFSRHTEMQIREIQQLLR